MYILITCNCNAERREYYFYWTYVPVVEQIAMNNNIAENIVSDFNSLYLQELLFIFKSAQF